MDSVASVHCLLRRRWHESLVTLSVQPAVWFCHRRGPNDEKFVAYGGLQAARESLMDLRRMEHAPTPILVFGFQGEALVRSKSAEHWPGSGRLLDWPGAAYLRYDANVETLRVTARASGHVLTSHCRRGYCTILSVCFDFPRPSVTGWERTVGLLSNPRLRTFAPQRVTRHCSAPTT